MPSTLRFFALVSLVGWVLSAPASAAAQRSLDIENFRPALDADGLLGVQGTTMPGPWQWNVGLWLNYSKQPLRGSAGDESFDLIRHRLGADLQAQLGLGGRGAIAVDVPMVLYQNGNLDALGDGGPALPAQAFGDPRITARVRVHGADATAQRTRRDGPGIALAGTLTLPLGDEDAFAGEGAVSLDLQGIADFRFFGIAAALMVGVRHRFEKEVIGDDEFRDNLLFGVGLASPIPLLEGLGARLEVRGVLDARFAGGPMNAVEGNLGLTYARNGITYLASVGTGFGSGVGTPTVRATFGLIWAPRTSDDDADLDGIPDAEDECPHLPEDFDGFEDEDGCMDPDNDNDFIPDVDDRCPLEAADEDNDEDEDGCTDR